MNGGSDPVDVTVSVHVYEQTRVEVDVFDNTARGPFVTVQLGDLPSTVSLFFRAEAAINALAAAVADARVKLIDAQTRAQQETTGQPELPVPC